MIMAMNVMILRLHLRQLEGLSEWRSLVNCALLDVILNLVLDFILHSVLHLIIPLIPHHIFDLMHVVLIA